MITAFDLAGYVDSSCQVTRRYGKGERLLRECPSCGARNHCSVNVTKQKWRCFKCEWRGDDVIKFVAMVENCDDADARELVLETGFDQRHPGEVEAALEEHAPAPVVAPSVAYWRAAMPAEYVPCYDRRTGKWNGVPTYLARRGIQRETIMTYRLGWCDRGRYAHRIVIPIITGNLATFQARATWSETHKKYDSPPDAPMSQMLMGYDLLRPGEELWVVEGPFDKLACHQAGLPAVPLIGKEMSEAQANLIVKLRPSRVHVMLDDDAEKWCRRVAARLAYRVPTDVVLLHGGDPADLGEELADQARRFIEVSRPGAANRLSH
jgi:hypothetical protein